MPQGLTGPRRRQNRISIRPILTAHPQHSECERKAEIGLPHVGGPGLTRAGLGLFKLGLRSVQKRSAPEGAGSSRDRWSALRSRNAEGWPAITRCSALAFNAKA